MYDELIAVLRHCGSLPCEGCPRETCEGGMANMLEAADAIEELSKPRWIPVMERLPSPMRAVLVYAPYKHNIFMAYVQGNKWYVWWPDEYCCKRWPEYHAITHWMNLPQDPEPPEEEA